MAPDTEKETDGWKQRLRKIAESMDATGANLAGENRGGNIFSGAENVFVSGGTMNSIGRDSVVFNITTPPSTTVEITLRDVLEWLPSDDYQSMQQDNFEKVVPGTGAWFKTGRAFGHWLDTDGSVLWARGMPGAGKSVITSMVVDIVEKKAKESGSVSVAYAYCRYSDAEDRVTVRSVLAGLVRQLLARHPSVLDIVEPVYREHQHEKTQATQSQLVGLLRDISTRFDINFRALDGVDELAPDVRHKLLQALSSIGGNLFVSSRPLPELEDSLSEADVVEVVAHDEDVALMIAHEIDQFPRLRDLLGFNAGPEKKERAIQMIQEKSHGMFLHAALQMEALRNAVFITSETIDKLPVKIEDLYSNTVRRIMGQSEEQRKIAGRVLLWLLYAARPLSMAELHSAVASDPDSESWKYDSNVVGDEKALVSVCCGLVTVEKESALVRLVHHTAKDALGSLLKPFFPSPHSLLARTCILWLVNNDMQESKLETVEQLEEALEKQPLLDYAHHFWGFHARECTTTPDDPLTSGIVQFIQKCQSFPHQWNGQDKLDHLAPLHIAAKYNLAHLLEQVMSDDTTAANKKKNSNNMVWKKIKKAAAAVSYANMVNTKTAEWGVTPLLLAATEGHVEVVQHLLSLDEGGSAKINQADVNGTTPLMAAAAGGHHAILDLLFHDARPEIVEQLVNMRDKDRRTALIMACAADSEQSVKVLLACHPQVQINSRCGVSGDCALNVAAKMGHEACFRLLMGAPATKVVRLNKKKETALMHAAAGGHLEIVKELLANDEVLNGKGENGLNGTNVDGLSALMFAAKEGRKEVVKVLLEVLPDVAVNATTKEGETALLLAARQGSEEVVEMLLGVSTAEIHTKDALKRTPLMWAAEGGYAGIVKRLLEVEGGAEHINLVDKQGESAVLLAARNGHTDVAVELLNADGIEVDCDNSNGKGETPLMLAAKGGHAGVVRALVDIAPVRVNIVDEGGRTPLMHAAALGHVGVMDEILNARSQNCVQANLHDGQGWTALSLAAENGYEECVESLLRHPDIQVNLDGSDTGDDDKKEEEKKTKKKQGKKGKGSGEESTRCVGTALERAARSGHESVVDRLLQAEGIQVNSNNSGEENDGSAYTPCLIYAAMNGHAHVVRRILQDADGVVKVNGTNEKGRTALIYAAKEGHEEVVRFLVGIDGVEVDVKDAKGWTAEMYAYKYGYSEILEALKRE